MFDGVAGTTAVTLTANRTAAAAPMLTWWSRPRAANSAQQASSCRAHAPSWATRRDRAAARVLEDVQPGPDLDQSAARIEATARADPALPLARTKTGASSTATSSSSGARRDQEELLGARVEEVGGETMIPPSSGRATMLSAVWETSVPISTVKVSRIRPTRRASTIALAGSPSRAGSVADISTPIIVAEVTSRRRTGRPGSAARAIETQEPRAGEHRRPTIRAQATSTQVEVGADHALGDLSTPILLRGEQRSARRPRMPAMPRPSRRATRWRADRRPGAGSSEGSRRGGPARPAVEPAPARCGARARSVAPVGLGRAPAPPRRPRRPRRRRAARRSARRCGARRLAHRAPGARARGQSA